ncbi:MAG: DUF4321 domain-containing protein [Defluviitaleaceae bacterium]|nr:DUF4321 domain-containing protein [Defluviitaleaceae bacterium]
MRRREKSIWMIILIALIGLMIGYFVGEFFVHLSQNVDALGFLSLLGHSVRFGLENIALNLIFANISFGFTINISVMGVVVMGVFLVIYFRR